MSNTSESKGVENMRNVAGVNAMNKAEAIAALELLLERVKNSEYDEGEMVMERVLISQEGTKTTQAFARVRV